MNEFGQEGTTQAVVAPVLSQAPREARGRRTWLVTIPLALIVIYAFMPILDNGFVPSWDDDENFLANPYFRGLGAAQVKWAWSTFLLGVYQPLAWLLFEAQYVFCHLDPRGYHLTSLILKVANAVVLYVLTVALLVRSRTDSRLESPWTCSLSAGLATALFAVHPLRVEAVAWASSQGHLPCILFSMLAVLAYLRAFPMDSSPRWGWLVCSFVLFVAALLFKAVAVGLPAVLLILDIYPLRRLGDGAGRWFGASARRALLEKVPFAMASLLFMGLATAVRAQSPFGIEHYDLSVGIAQACYAIWFCISKTVLPLDLIALYPLPGELNWLAFPYNLSILATLATSAGLFLLRRGWPGLLAAWLSYLVLLAPSSGIIRNNFFAIAADRYSYTAMLGSVMLVAACSCRLWRMCSRVHPEAAIGLIAIGLAALLGLTAMTRNQCRTWRNSETLWAHALAHGANSSFVAHNNLGIALQAKGSYEEAAAHFTLALRLNPGFDKVHHNLGAVLAHQGKYEAAEAHFAEAARLDPLNAQAQYNLGAVLAHQGKYKAAEAHFAEAARLDPLNAQAHYNLGTVLYRLRNYATARAHFTEVIRLDPGYAEAYNASAIIMAVCPEAKVRDGKGAVKLATRACELTEWKNPRFLNTLASAQAEAGDWGAAVSSQKRAIELLTDERQKNDYRSRLVLYQAKRPYREVSPQRAPTGARP